jgi:hypothetical protein
VGYDSLSRKYRLYDPQRRTIISSRNVTFWEEEVDPSPPARENDDEEVGDETESQSASSSSQSTTTTPSTPSPVKKIKMEAISEEEDEFEDADEEVDTTLIVTTPEGEEEYKLDEVDENIVIPSRRDLRRKSKIHVPARFRANMASIPTEPKTFNEATTGPDAENWHQAMVEEIESLEKNNTWEIVPKPKGFKILDPKWVYKIKKDENGDVERWKARLVIRGFRQEANVDFFETFSTVCRYESIRLILSLTATNGLRMKQFDVKTAFLNGLLEEEIYMRQPPGFTNGNSDEVCRLLRTLYGLKQSPRGWYKRCSNFLHAIGLDPTNSDPCIYTGIIDKSFAILVLYVDDGLVISANNAAIDQILIALGEEFEISIKDKVEKFVGIQICRDEDGMYLSQPQYIHEMLEKFNMLECRPSSTPMQPNLDLVPALESNDKLPYRELIGSLLFLARVTRPDIAYAVCKLSQFNHGYDETHWRAAKDILRYLRGTVDYSIHYQKRDDGEFIITAYTDSDYAGDKIDRKSTTGFITEVDGGLISWGSQKQEIVTLSSTEAEYVALTTGSREVVWLRSLSNELKQQQQSATTIYVDNTSAIRLVENPEFHKRTKHIDVRYHYIRELAEKEEVKVKYISTNEQKADILTKPLQRAKHEENVDRLRLNHNNGRKGKGKGPNSFLTLLTFMACLALTGAVDIQNSLPVLWRGSKTPVISGYEKLYMRINLINPCTLITSDVVHTDSVEEAKRICNEMYHNYFISELEKMCPRFQENFEASKKRNKRFVIIGAIIVGAIVLTSLGIAGVSMAAVNMYKISELEDIKDMQQREIENLNGNMNLTEIAMGKLRHDFNILAKEQKIHEEDFNEYKAKSPTTHFTLSYITTRLMLGKQILKEATRAWLERKVHMGLMDYFNITLPCEDKACPLHLATGRSCSFSNNYKDLFMQLDVPKINTDVDLVEADPFNIMIQTWNQTCSVAYTGPKNAILSKESGCPIALNVKISSLNEVVLSTSQECMVGIKNNSINSYFSVEHCYPRGEKDAEDFIQVKPHHGSLHIYCFGNKITIENVTQECPRNVFILPFGATFFINNRKFIGAIVHKEHQDRPDPLFTLRANHYLRPRVDYNDLLKDPMLNYKFTVAEGSDHYHWTHDSSIGLIIGIIIMTIIVLVLACIITKCYLDNRKIRVRVVQTRKKKSVAPATEMKSEVHDPQE